MEIIVGIIGILFISGILAYIIRYVYRKKLAMIATRILMDVSGNTIEPPPTIRDLYEHIEYFRMIRDGDGELDKTHPLYKRKMNGDDVAYQ